MASPILIPKKSTIADKVPLPEQLAGGEVSVNWADQVWHGKHPGTNAVIPIGAPAIHSHDELYSLDKSQHIELQNNGDLTLPNGGTISDSSVAEGSITLTPPSATNQWTLGVDGSTIFPNNTLKGYSFTATNTVTNYIPQAGSFLYSDSAILGLISSIGGAWYIKGPGLVGWKQITQAQDNSGVALILRIGSGNTPLPDGSEFPSGGGNVYTISQYIEFDLKVADKTWVFNNGNLTLPASGDILDSNGTSVLGGGGGVSTTPANSGLAITDDSIATVYNTTVPDATVSMAVGGASAAAASSWKTKTVVQVLDEILFPTVLASVGLNKSVSLAVNGANGVLEIGESYTRALTATFNRGTIINGSGATNSNPLVGAAEDYTFTGTGISSTTQAGNTLTFTADVVSGSNNWAVTVTHGAGSGAYFDNKGAGVTNLNASRVVGSVTDSSSSPAITGVYPYYYYKSTSPISVAAMVAAIENGTATKVVASSSGTLSIPYNVTAQYLAVAYPTTSTLKTRYFVTVSDADAVTVVFQNVATPSVTTSLWAQTYNVHVSKSALTNTNAIIELRNS